MNRRLLALPIAAWAMVLGACSIAGPEAPEALRCEYLTRPVAIGEAKPRFTWEVRDGRRGAVQTAYEVHVASTADSARSDSPDVWSSRMILSSQSSNVAYAGRPLRAGERLYWCVRTWDAGGHASAWSEATTFAMGPMSEGDWGGAKWIGDATPAPEVKRVSVPAAKEGERPRNVLEGMDALPAPMLRKEFDVSVGEAGSPTGGGVKRATLYISALGLYEARINGVRVGDHDLAPEWTDYTTRVQYQGYDVTKMLRDGRNALGVTLGDGWYAGRLGMAQQFSAHKWPRAVYGRQPRLIAELLIEMNDGSTRRVVSDGSWRSTIDGPIRSADLLDGETVDARRRIAGWDAPGFAEGASTRAAWKPVVVDEEVKAALVAQSDEPIRVLQELAPVAVNEIKPGVWVFDMGQNMAGRCRVFVKGKAGAEITLRHAEAVNDDGTIYTANLRGAPQVDHYTLAGDAAGEIFEPRFTYHGFRFVEVSAASGEIEPPKLSDVRGMVTGSSAPMAGAFETSSPLLNRLWLNILWTQHANMMGVPTDCPQRDERLGWTGDIVAFAQTAMFNKDMAGFFTKWFQDVRDAQADNGMYADIAPHPYGKNRQFTGVPAWGDVGVSVPWEAYVNYGDARMLERHFASAKRWVDWIHSQNPDLLWKKGRHNDYNDWLNGDTLIHEGWPKTGAGVPHDLLATAFFARSTEQVAEMARVLGKTDDEKAYRALAGEIRAAFEKAYIGSDGKMTGDTQAGYALALNFHLVPDDLRPKLVERLVAGIHAYDNHLSTGFHASQPAMQELSNAGQSPLAYELALDTRFPSWGYSISNGATTIWERWDGYVKGRGFQDPGMNSLNHWALGSVGEWMNRVILGINPDPASPGYAHFTLSPEPGGGLTYARGSYHSIRGVISSAWRVEGDTTTYTFAVPANTTATIRLRASGSAAIRESGRELADAQDVRVSGEGDGVVTMEVGSGKYVFEVRE